MDATRGLGAHSSAIPQQHQDGARMRIAGIALVAGLMVFSGATAAADDARALAAQGKALVEAKDPARAFGLLAPHEEQLGGDIEFDYWLGVAALETSRLDRAVIAF